MKLWYLGGYDYGSSNTVALDSIGTLVAAGNDVVVVDATHLVPVHI